MTYSALDRRLEGKSLIDQCRLVEIYLLDVFVEICERHNLQYFLAYGTLLGALRHNGFIPWDDDIDVGMPQPDYDMFLKIVERELPEGILLDCPKTNPAAHSYAKLRDRYSFFCEFDTISAHPCGIFLDIFPFQRFPKLNAKTSRLLSLSCGIACWSAAAHRKLAHHTCLGMLVGFFKATVWTFIYNALTFLLRLLSFIKPTIWRARPENNGTFIEHPGIAKPHVGFTDDQLFPLQKHVFEGKLYNVPHDAEGVLTQLYGDWRTPPPEGKRQWHHSIVCPTQAPDAPWALPYPGNSTTSDSNG